ncbi:hypothetical protein F4780DRAFT_552532 [Xylariomycetidae sp. FL0641]|nr:hypothetical protein F4780DRAFT_552532 [Xylariomycetidae sp. FL0641]
MSRMQRSAVVQVFFMQACLCESSCSEHTCAYLDRQVCTREYSNWRGTQFLSWRPYICTERVILLGIFEQILEHSCPKSPVEARTKDPYDPCSESTPWSFKGPIEFNGRTNGGQKVAIVRPFLGTPQSTPAEGGKDLQRAAL